jgi:hypothetical protein
VAPSFVGCEVTGAFVGFVDGLDVGQLVVGSAVGIDDGDVDGCEVGCLVGCIDGRLIGCVVG